MTTKKSDNRVRVSDNAKNTLESIELKTKVFNNDSFFIDCEIKKPASVEKITSAIIIDYLIYIDSQCQAIIDNNLQNDKMINKLQTEVNLLTKKLVDSKEKVVKESSDNGQNQITINFTDNDFELIEKTALHTDLTLQDLIKDSAMSAIKRLDTMAKNAKSTSNIKGTAKQRIDILVSNIIKFNEQTTNTNLRIYINKSILRDALGTNFNTLKDYFLDNQQMIDSHHAMLGITPNYNLKKPGGWQLGKYVNIPD